MEVVDAGGGRDRGRPEKGAAGNGAAGNQGGIDIVLPVYYIGPFRKDTLSIIVFS